MKYPYKITGIILRPDRKTCYTHIYGHTQNYLDLVLVNPEEILLFEVSVAAEDLRESTLKHFDDP